MKSDWGDDLIKLMRRASVASNAGEIVIGLSHRGASSKTPNSPAEEVFPFPPNTKLIAALASLYYPSDRRERVSRPLEASDAARVLKYLDQSLPVFPEKDTAFTAAVDDHLFATVRKVAPDIAPIFVERCGIPDELPLVTEIGKEFAGQVDLRHCVLIAVQHLLGSSVPVFKWLNRLGIPYNRMHIVGKVYSANSLVVAKLTELGARVSPGSLEYPEKWMYSGQRNYELQLRAQIAQALRAAVDDLSAMRAREKCMLVLDDGGHVVDILAAEFSGNLKTVIAVEQTRKGVEQIRKRRWEFPIANVAESASKLDLESPLIGQSIVEQLASRLRRTHGQGSLSHRTALVLGYGSVGSAVATWLRKFGAKDVIVFDQDAEKVANAARAKFKVVTELKNGLQHSQLVVGCTGNSSLPRDFERNLPDAIVLASGSTSDLEFREIGLTLENRAQWYEHLPTNWSTDHLRVHSDYRMNSPQGRFWLLNGGFPINFDGSVDPIVPCHIQLTRALMLAGVCQLAESQGESGLVPLSRKYDQYVREHYQLLTNGYQ